MTVLAQYLRMKIRTIILGGVEIIPYLFRDHSQKSKKLLKNRSKVEKTDFLTVFSILTVIPK